ncbi:zinc-binding dehydrogenase [Psychrobacter sp. AOP22-C1-22]|uniref:zinc-binding dehydrogenase n=1 Tax=unclassified Psychrobacter TaxID=196806 RepID=UPI0017885BB9|nr:MULTISPECIES: zinc-binding dehydrogenase [unclassified Psychrobacter]MBE0405689.1 zinc-binding dehydrogenase [Psychrobacter sp. FME6]MBE0445466.1 zinc-binding dehydrogenase [Psychrobacter sp. FME5]MDN5801456.1 zinc-binding dehydrogenase [Psychrobacter sp.]MDN5897935.1 zinc-binding dehydrogenase [Psychrobacter sp.]
MRSATYNNFGKPSEVLSVTDSPTPEPKGNEVRIKTILSSIHNHDLVTIKGEYGNKPKLPATGGSEAVGTIDLLGKDVASFKKGQRVVVSGVEGTWAEYFIAPAQRIIPIPDAIDDEMAAQLIAMPMSALLLIEFLNIEPGQWIIQNAANGAVGESMAMLAPERNINTINLVRSKESEKELIELGITKNNVVTDDDDWKEQVQKIVGDAKINGAVDAVGGKSGGELLSLLGKHGAMASLGSMSGEPLMINPSHLIFNLSKVKGFWASDLMQEISDDDMQRLTKELIERAASGTLKLPTGGVYNLADIQKAVSEKVQSEKKGKVLIKP